MLLAVALLTRLQVGEVDHRLLHVVERHVLHVVRIGVVRPGEGEVGRLRAVEEVERLRGLAQRADRHVAHPAAIDRIVDVEIGEHRVDRPDLHPVVVAVDMPAEVVERPHRVAEEVGFERFADAALLLGRIGLLSPLLRLLVRGIGIVAVESRVVAVLLRPHQRPGVETLGVRTHRPRNEQHGACQQKNTDRRPPHKPRKRNSRQS